MGEKAHLVQEGAPLVKIATHTRTLRQFDRWTTRRAQRGAQLNERYEGRHR
jgi:hypothetical protein